MGGKTSFALFTVAAVLAGGLLIGHQAIRAADTDRSRLPNAFFAMNFERGDPAIAASQPAQAKLLKELGYDGTLYLGPLERLGESLRVFDAAGVAVVAAAVSPYNVSVDPGETCPEHLKEAIKKLAGRKTLLTMQFVSKKYDRGSAEGDPRAVELAQELADFARPYGVRVVLYPHIKIWCERLDHAVRIARQCGRDNFGVCFNQYHWMQTDPHGDLNALVRAAMPHLFAVTINGASADGKAETLDRGDYDVVGFLRPFIAAGYRGPIGLQCVGVLGDARDKLTRSMDAWKKISARLAAEAKP